MAEQEQNRPTRERRPAADEPKGIEGFVTPRQTQGTEAEPVATSPNPEPGSE